MTTTLAGGRAARRQTMRRIRPRRSPAVPLLLAVWAGAAGVLWLWWRNTPAISDDAGKILGAGRITGLLAGYLMALVVLQMARVPALERRVGSDRVARWHAMTGRYTLCLVLAHVFLIMWGYAAQAGKGLGDIVAQTVDSVNQLPDMGKAAIGTGLLVVIGFLSVGPSAAGSRTTPGTTCTCSPTRRCS
ncbi:Ferredoxin reductase family protein OS=Streptomyces tendae OX=1932 GN=GUR47_33345 PE=4 SV=1 [Streptomyces tendae]